MTIEIYIELLKKCADNLERRYLCPVYLVGSFPDKFRDASDIDIIMVADDKRMKRLCGKRLQAFKAKTIKVSLRKNRRSRKDRDYGH